MCVAGYPVVHSCVSCTEEERSLLRSTIEKKKKKRKTRNKAVVYVTQSRKREIKGSLVSDITIPVRQPLSIKCQLFVESFVKLLLILRLQCLNKICGFECKTALVMSQIKPSPSSLSLSLFHSPGLPLASGDAQLVTLGTGERFKRTTLPHEAPRKPERRTPGHSPSTTPALQRKKEEEEEEDEREGESEVPGGGVGVGENKTEPETGTGLMYMNLNAEGEVDSAEGEIDEPPWEGSDEGEREGRPREAARDKRTSRRAKRQRERLSRDRERQEEKERRQREKREERDRKLKEKSKSPPPLETTNNPALPLKERTESLANGKHEREKEDDRNSTKAAEVVMTAKPNDVTACGQSIVTTFDTRGAGEGSLTAVCKGTKTKTVETSVCETSNGEYRVKFTPEEADMFMLGVCWCGVDVPGSPFLINLNLLPPAEQSASGEGEREEGGREEGEREEGGREEGEREEGGREEGGREEGGREEGGREEGGREEGGREEGGREEGGREIEQSDGGGNAEARDKVDQPPKKDELEEAERDPTKLNNGQRNGRGEDGTNGGEVAEVTGKRDSREMREKSPVIVVSEDPFDMAYEAQRLLGKIMEPYTQLLVAGLFRSG